MMANVSEGADARLAPGKDGDRRVRAGDKRPSSQEASDSTSPKKFSMSLGKKAALPNQKISLNLGGSTTSSANSKPASGLLSKPKPSVAPIKMSLGGAQKSKDPPPIVQKSALAAKVFDESDESDGEEMPPEAKMRMKNIGRDTPTASGPNSYGKGKQGFVDRHKIIEKQLKEDMEKVSGDNSKKKNDVS